jgi:hypothetical protein
MTVISVQDLLKSGLPLGYTGSSSGYTGSSSGYTGSKGESSFAYSDTPPGSPLPGDRWFSSLDGGEYVWTYDGTSGQWVEVAASGFIGATGYVGSQGVAGAFAGMGYTGSASPGYQGSAGAGYTGSRGVSGAYAAMGYVGSRGLTGDQGILGYVGSSAPGYTGSAGTQGYYGSMGYMGSGAISTTVGPTLPAWYSDGYTWLDTTTGDLYVYYQGTWFSVSGANATLAIIKSTAPTNPPVGQIWYDTSASTLKIWTGGIWLNTLSNLGADLTVAGRVYQNGQITPSLVETMTFTLAF